MEQIEDKSIQITPIDKSIYWDEISEKTQKVLSAKEGANTVDEFVTREFGSDILEQDKDGKYYYENIRGEKIYENDDRLMRHAVHSEYLQFKVPFKVGEDIDLKPYYIKAMKVFDYFVKQGMVHNKMFKQPFTVLINDHKIQSPWSYMLKKGSYEFKEILDQTSEIPVGSGFSAPILKKEGMSEEEQKQYDDYYNKKAVVIAIWFYNSLKVNGSFDVLRNFVNMAVGTKVLMYEGQSGETDWGKVDEFLEKIK